MNDSELIRFIDVSEFTGVCNRKGETYDYY